MAEVELEASCFKFQDPMSRVGLSESHLITVHTRPLHVSFI